MFSWILRTRFFSSVVANNPDRQGDSVLALLAALKACCATKSLTRGRRIHAEAVENELQNDVRVANSLINMYSKCGSMADARRVFEEIPRKTLVSWSTLILGYAVSGQSETALQFFATMEAQGFVPESRSYVAALKAVASIAAREEDRLGKISWLGKGMDLHSKASKTGSSDAFNMFFASALVDMYAKCGSMLDARSAFDRMKHHDVVSWTALIQGYVDNGNSELALQLFEFMEELGCSPNSRTFVALFMACASLADAKVEILKTGIDIHFRASKLGCDSNIFVANTLVDMYMRCGSVVRARKVFDSISQRTVVSWNNLIRGYAENGEAEIALQEFNRMRVAQGGCEPNHRTFVAALSACGNLVALETGRRLHAEIRDRDFQTDHIVANCLVDFYGKCGSMEDAQKDTVDRVMRKPFSSSSEECRTPDFGPTPSHSFQF